MANIRVEYSIARKDIPPQWQLHYFCQTALKEMRKKGEVYKSHVHIKLVGAQESRRLNRDYRGKDKPTNVLSFPFYAPENLSDGLLGDLVICVPVLAQEAFLQRKPLAHHWAHILVHGILHLLGFDHMERAQAKQMEKIEVRILKKLRIADPYISNPYKVTS